MAKRISKKPYIGIKKHIIKGKWVASFFKKDYESPIDLGIRIAPACHRLMRS